MFLFIGFKRKGTYAFEEENDLELLSF